MIPSLRLSFFLHFFRGDLQYLPDDMISLQPSMDFLDKIIIIPIADMPKDFTQEWLIEQARFTLTKH